MSPRGSARVARRAWAPALVLAAIAGCTGGSSSCPAPSSGSFTLRLSFSQSLSAALSCDAAPAAGGSCTGVPHPLDGATLAVKVSGSSATVTPAGQPSWACQAIGPDSPPGSAPDGAAVPGTSCYLRVTCDHQSLGDAGPADIDLEILAPGASDVLVLVHDEGGSCCSDEYRGTWR